MRGLPPLPLSSHLNYKKDDPGASGCVALRCTATKSGEIRGKGRGNVFRRGGRKREKGGERFGFRFWERFCWERRDLASLRGGKLGKLGRSNGEIWI